MQNLTEIKNHIVKNAFPELVNLEIPIRFEKVKNGISEFKRSGNRYSIIVSEIMKKAPVDILEASIAHELAHILKEIKIGLINSWLDGILYYISKSYRIFDERDTDFTVVVRGYGKHLLTLYEYRKTLQLKDYDDNGLLQNEIEKLLFLTNTTVPPKPLLQT